jgi:hypothetical protein
MVVTRVVDHDVPDVFTRVPFQSPVTNPVERRDRAGVLLVGSAFFRDMIRDREVGWIEFATRQLGEPDAQVVTDRLGVPNLADQPDESRWRVATQSQVERWRHSMLLNT